MRPILLVLTILLLAYPGVSDLRAEPVSPTSAGDTAHDHIPGVVPYLPVPFEQATHIFVGTVVSVDRKLRFGPEEYTLARIRVGRSIKGSFDHKQIDFFGAPYQTELRVGEAGLWSLQRSPEVSDLFLTTGEAAFVSQASIRTFTRAAIEAQILAELDQRGLRSEPDKRMARLATIIVRGDRLAAREAIRTLAAGGGMAGSPVLVIATHHSDREIRSAARNALARTHQIGWIEDLERKIVLEKSWRAIEQLNSPNPSTRWRAANHLHSYGSRLFTANGGAQTIAVRRLAESLEKESINWVFSEKVAALRSLTGERRVKANAGHKMNHKRFLIAWKIVDAPETAME